VTTFHRPDLASLCREASVKRANHDALLGTWVTGLVGRERRFGRPFGGRVPSSNRTTHLSVVRALRRGADPLSLLLAHRKTRPALAQNEPSLRPSVTRSPAKGSAIARRSRCVPPLRTRAEAPGSLLEFARVGLLPRSTCAPKRRRRFADGRARASFDWRSARRDEPSTRFSLDRTVRRIGCFQPFEPRDRSAQRRFP